MIQRTFKLYLFRKKNYNNRNKQIIIVKVFKIILRECIVCHIRKKILEEFKKKIPFIINKVNNQINEYNKMIFLSPNKEKNNLIHNNEKENIKINDNFNKLNNEEKLNDNNNEIVLKKNVIKINQNKNENQTKKKKSNLLIPIINKKKETKEDTIQNYNINNNNNTNNNNRNKINNNNPKKKKIFIQTKIIEDDIPIQIYNTEQNKEQNKNYNPSNFILVRGTIDSNDSQIISPKRNIKKLKKDRNVEDSGSIIFNDREIYVNKNYYNYFNQNDKQKKMRSAFFNIIVNNIKK